MNLNLYRRSNGTSSIIPQRKGSPGDGRGLSPFPLLPVLIGLILLAFAGSKFWERFYDNPDLDKAEVEAAQEEAEEISQNHEEWTQYVLRANTTMIRPC